MKKNTQCDNKVNEAILYLIVNQTIDYMKREQTAEETVINIIEILNVYMEIIKND